MRPCFQNKKNLLPLILEVLRPLLICWTCSLAPLHAMDQGDASRWPTGQVVSTQGKRLPYEFEGLAEPTQVLSAVSKLVRPLAPSASFEDFQKRFSKNQQILQQLALEQQVLQAALSQLQAEKQRAPSSERLWVDSGTPSSKNPIKTPETLLWKQVSQQASLLLEAFEPTHHFPLVQKIFDPWRSFEALFSEETPVAFLGRFLEELEDYTDLGKEWVQAESKPSNPLKPQQQEHQLLASLIDSCFETGLEQFAEILKQARETSSPLSEPLSHADFDLLDQLKELMWRCLTLYASYELSKKVREWIQDWHWVISPPKATSEKGEEEAALRRLLAWGCKQPRSIRPLLLLLRRKARQKGAASFSNVLRGLQEVS